MINEKRLTEPITEGGISWINFFNGRLLSGEDLSKEQNSNLEGRRRLGRAIGEGVAYGLEVSVLKDVNTRETPYVVVEQGLAINRQGQTLWLENQTKVRLKRPINADKTDAAEITFDDCQPLQPGVYVADAGVYLLTIAPARKNEGRAAVSGLDNVIARCNTHHAIEGVQFRLIQLGLNAAELNDTRLRNIIAYKCFGIDNTKPPAAFTIDPLREPPPTTLLDDLRPRLLTDCDVPLAIINWTSTEGIKFVDMWSVRRRISAPSPTGLWEAMLDESRRSEGEAMFLQFQEQAESLLQKPEVLQIKAKDHFHHLPPIGLLAVDGVPNVAGFHYSKFFEELTYREPVFIEGARLRALFQSAVSYPPVNLASGLMFWLYWVRENMQEINRRTSGQPRPYLVFASGQIPFVAEPRFDVAHWDYSNFV